MASDKDVPKDSTDRKAHRAGRTAERGPDLEQAGSESPEKTESEDRESESSEEPTSTKSHSDSQQETSKSTTAPENPPLPNEAPPPPLPNEPLPDQAPPDDGWEPVWNPNNQAFYFYNKISGATQWENPRVPEATEVPTAQDEQGPEPAPILHGGYNPAIHGDYDPNASYALEARAAQERAAAAVTAQPPLPGAQAGPDYSATGSFNRFTGRWQASDITPDNYNDDAKSRRQMNAFFDVDAAANSHEGRSLKAERSGMKLTKAELKQFKEKRRERKEEKRRAWLRD